MINLNSIFDAAVSSSSVVPSSPKFPSLVLVDDEVGYTNGAGETSQKHRVTVKMDKKWVEVQDHGTIEVVDGVLYNDAQPTNWTLFKDGKVCKQVPTLLIDVYPKAQSLFLKQVTVTSEDGSKGVQWKSFKPAIEGKNYLLEVKRKIEACDFTLADYTMEAVKANEELVQLLNTFSQCGVAIDSTCTKCVMRSFWVLKDEATGKYHLKMKLPKVNKKRH